MIQADRDQDRQIGLDLQRYLVRGCFTPEQEEWALKKFSGTGSFSKYRRAIRGNISLCGSIGTIEVEDERVTLRSGLENDGEGRAAGSAFCDLIQGSDVADNTEGHELQDKEGKTIKVCPALTYP